MQAMIRGFHARKKQNAAKYAAIEGKRDVERRLKVQVTAATKLQTMRRGYAIRRDKELLTTLSRMRGARERKDVASMHNLLKSFDEGGRFRACLKSGAHVAAVSKEVTASKARLAQLLKEQTLLDDITDTKVSEER